MLPEPVSVAVLSQTGDVLISWYSHGRHDLNEVRTSSVYRYLQMYLYLHEESLFLVCSEHEQHERVPLTFILEMKWYYMLRWCDLHWTCILKILGLNRGQVIGYLDHFSECSSIYPVECSGNASKCFTHLALCRVTEHDWQLIHIFILEQYPNMSFFVARQG